MTTTLVLGSDTGPSAARGLPKKDVLVGHVRPSEVPTIAVVAESEVRFGPILIKSVAVASLLFFFGVGLPMLALTGEIWDGIGLGAFTAFWGGPGFGLMAAGAIWSTRNEHA